MVRPGAGVLLKKPGRSGATRRRPSSTAAGAAPRARPREPGPSRTTTTGRPGSPQLAYDSVRPSGRRKDDSCSVGVTGVRVMEGMRGGRLRWDGSCDVVSQSRLCQDCETVSTPQRTPRVSSAEARRRILEAARALLVEQSFADLTVDSVMATAGLT